MENTNENEQFEALPEEQEEGYVPRPAWQVWVARAALVIFILIVIYQLISISRGGL